MVQYVFILNSSLIRTYINMFYIFMFFFLMLTLHIFISLINHPYCVCNVKTFRSAILNNNYFLSVCILIYFRYLLLLTLYCMYWTFEKTHARTEYGPNDRYRQRTHAATVFGARRLTATTPNPRWCPVTRMCVWLHFLHFCWCMQCWLIFMI